MSLVVMNEKEFLDSYNINKYWKPSVAADILLFAVEQTNNIKEIKVLLIKRGEFPFKNSWALPGGFLEEGETLLETANRELKEETNIDSINLKQLIVSDDLKRDPRGRIISLTFIGVVETSNIDIKYGDDASNARLFNIGFEKVKDRNIKLNFTSEEQNLSSILRLNDINCSNLSIEMSAGLAFDHAKIIYYGLQYLLNKAERDKISISSEKIYIEIEEFYRLKKDLEECIYETF
jgi:ADP-ribose pyrophosphatase YjhB (NUDIX family)